MSTRVLSHAPLVCVPAQELDTIDAALSTYTEDDLKPVATPDSGNVGDSSGTPPVRVMMSGSPASAIDATLDVHTHGGVDATGRYTYTPPGGSAHGQTAQWVPTALETLWAITTGSGYQAPDLLALPDGAILCFAEDWHGGTETIVCRRRDPDTELWGSIVIVWTAIRAFTAANPPSPASWWVAADTAVGYRVFLLTQEEDDSGDFQIRIDVSDDGGATWAGPYYSQIVLESGSGNDLFRVAYEPLSDIVRLVFRYNTGAAYEGHVYTSSDRGSSWTRLDDADIVSYRRGDLTCWASQFVLVYTDDATGDTSCVAATPAQTTWTTRDSAFSTSTALDLAIDVDASGHVWVFDRPAANSSALLAYQSVALGERFGNPSVYPPTHIGVAAQEVVGYDQALGALTSGLRIESACYQQGQWHLIGRLLSAGTTIDRSLCSMIIGRVESVTRKLSATPVSGIAIWHPYYPSDIPATKSAQYTWVPGAGPSAESITTDTRSQIAYRIDASGTTGYIQHSTGAAELLSQSVHWQCSRDSAGGQSTLPEIMIQVHANQVAAGTYVGIQLRIDFTNRQVRAYDVNAGVLGAGAVGWAGGDDVEFFIDVSWTALKGSAWVRNMRSRQWTEIAVNQTLVAALGGTNTIQFGKGMAAAGNDIYTFLFRPGQGEGHHGGIDTTKFRGILATSSPDRCPVGAHLWWQGSPLQPRDSWVLRTIGQQPIYNALVTGPISSPSRVWMTGVGTAARTELIAWDLGSGYDSPLSWQLLYAGLGNVAGVETIRMRYRSGGIWVTEFAIPCAINPFGAVGAVVWRRNGTSIRPNGVNGTPRIWRENEMAGWRAILRDDSGHILYCPVSRNGTGQFSNAAGALQMEIEFGQPYPLSPHNWAAMDASAATGGITLYPPYIVGVGAGTHESQQYLALEYDLTAYDTQAQFGHVSMGRAHMLGRQERAGGSIEYLSRDEVRVLDGTRQLVRRRGASKRQRRVELPFETIVVPVGRHEDGILVNTVSPDGVTPRALEDNNIDVLEHLNEYVGQRYPIWLMPDAQFGADPGTTVQVYYGDETLLGTLETSFSRVAARGQIVGRGHGHTQGGSLIVTEDT